MGVGGRKNAYQTIIKPRFSDISEWLKSGATEAQICSNLGIKKTTWYKYKAEYQEFAEIITNGRQGLVTKLRGVLVSKAMGFEYTERKTVRKTDATGAVTETYEETVKSALPDVAALNLCLKNYDKENWANDPQMLDIKKEELELKKKAIEEGDW